MAGLSEQEEFELLSLEREKSLSTRPRRDIAAEIANDPISRGARESAKPTMGEELARQTLMTGRYGMEGLGLGTIADKIGLPQPQGWFERVIGDTARTMAGTAGIAGLFGKLAPGAQGLTQKMAKMLSSAPASQIASAAGGGVASGAARESGAGPMGQMGAAMAGGMAVPLAQNAVGAVGRVARNVVDPLLPGGIDRTVARTANLAAGDKRADVLRALQNPDDFVGAPVTAGEAAAKAGSAEFSGLQEVVKGRFPSQYDAIAQGQNQARAAALRKFGETPADVKWYEEWRAAVTNPMRAEALSNANVAGVKVPQLQGRIAKQNDSLVSALQDKGRFQTMAAQQENLAHGGNAQRTGEQLLSGESGNLSPSAYPVSGYPRIPGRYTANIDRVPEAQSAATDTAQIVANRQAQAGLSQYQLDSLAAHGHYPLEAGKVVGAIDKMLATPGDRAVSLNQKILGAVRDKIASLANKDGVIDSRDLYAVRKTDINDVVATLTKDMDASTKNRAATLVGSIKADIDNAIEGAGGTGWKDYLRTYQDMSRNIDQMRVGQYLEGKLTAPMSEQGAGVGQRAGMYAQAMRDAPGTIKRSTGNPRYDDLAQVLTPDQLAVTQNVGKDLGRSAEQSRLGNIGKEKARTLLGDVSPALPAAGMFSPHYSVLRAILNRLHGRVEGKSLDALAKAMQDPREMARIMQAATPAEKAVLAPYLPTAPIFVGANAMGQQP